MTVESAGFPQALGSRYEVGIVQIDLQDGPKYGGTTDNLHTAFCASATSQVRTRDLTDDEENLQVDVANAYISDLWTASLAQTSGLDWSDDDVWCLVKLHHALPGLASQGFAAAQQAGQASSWDAMRQYLEGLPCSTFTWGCQYSPWSRFFDNAEKIGKLGLIDQVGQSSLVLLLAIAFAGWLLLRYVG